MHNRLIIWASLILAVVFLGLAALYWTTPAGNLPQFLPGYEVGVTTTHFKHGLAAFILAIALLILAWFKSGPKSANPVAREQ